MTVYEQPSPPSAGIPVRKVLHDPGHGLSWRLLAGAQGLERLITHPRVQKSGLALVGHLHGLVPTRIQIVGETELSFVEGLAPEAQRRAAKHLFSALPSCVFISRGANVPQALIDEAEKTTTPLVLAQEKSSTVIMALHTMLDEYLAPRARLHGVLVDIFEVGVLLTGQSGIGKSECALELVMRGHRLVADDVVECDYRPPGMIFGEPADPLRHFMEVRGLGILNIKDLYGVTAVRDRKRIDLVVGLELWKEGAEYDRIGVDDHYYEILGVSVRMVRLPIQPGRNMSSIIEIAARAELLRRAGHHPAKEFIDRIERATHGTGYVEDRPPSSTFNPAPVAGNRRTNESAAPPPVNSYEGQDLYARNRKEDDG